MQAKSSDAMEGLICQRTAASPSSACATSRTFSACCASFFWSPDSPDTTKSDRQRRKPAAAYARTAQSGFFTRSRTVLLRQRKVPRSTTRSGSTLIALTAVYLGNADHCGILRRQAARRNRLQRHNQLGGGDDRGRRRSPASPHGSFYR